MSKGVSQREQQRRQRQSRRDTPQTEQDRFLTLLDEAKLHRRMGMPTPRPSVGIFDAYEAK